jgi:hypothetical protein
MLHIARWANTAPHRPRLRQRRPIRDLSGSSQLAADLVTTPSRLNGMPWIAELRILLRFLAAKSPAASAAYINSPLRA